MLFNPLPLNPLPVRAWIAIFAVTAALAFVGWQQWRIASLKAAVSETKLALSEASRTIDQCNTAVSLQNQTIQQWKAEAENRTKTAQRELLRANQARRDAESRARAIYSVALTGDECEDLRAVVDAARVGGLRHNP